MTDLDSAIEGLNDQIENARRMAFRLIGMLKIERDTLVKANEHLRKELREAKLAAHAYADAVSQDRAESDHQNPEA